MFEPLEQSKKKTSMSVGCLNTSFNLKSRHVRFVTKETTASEIPSQITIWNHLFVRESDTILPLVGIFGTVGDLFAPTSAPTAGRIEVKYPAKDVTCSVSINIIVNPIFNSPYFYLVNDSGFSLTLGQASQTEKYIFNANIPIGVLDPGIYYIRLDAMTVSRVIAATLTLKGIRDSV